MNPMLGPSSDALIHVGARFPPCMKLVSEVPLATKFGCENVKSVGALSYTHYTHRP